jgi:hypothetical protein
MGSGVALFDYDNDGRLDIFLVNGAPLDDPTPKGTIPRKTGPKYWNRLFHQKSDGTFEDMTETAGLQGVGYGMGVAVGDYDNDGYEDLYVTAYGGNRLYHNNGNGTFTDVTARAGVAGTGYGMGVAVGDYDNDGWPDIYLANVNGNQLFHNNGDGTFTDVTAKAGVGGAMLKGRKMWSISAGWFDYNNDGLLDLFVSNYCQWDPQHEPACMGTNGRGYCHPKSFAPLPNTLYRNNGDGTFTDVSSETGIATVEGKGMGVVFADYDGDGFMDVFVANDNSPNLLFHNLGGKKFEEVAFTAGVAYNEDGNQLAGMGADFRDVDNDGLPDIWHTAIENETFPLFRNLGRGQFGNVTQRSRLAQLTREMSGWSNGAADLDNDGWKDLFVARGNVLDNVAQFSNRKYEEPNAVFRNLGNGKFQDVSAEAGPDFQKAAAHRGVAFGDIDNDGRIDAVVSVLNGKVKYFHNISKNGNHWILLKLTGKKSNRMALGAQIRITGEDGAKQYNEVTTAVGYACASDSRVHFGLGASKTIREIDIKWPSRIHQVLHNVAADQILAIEEPAQGNP